MSETLPISETDLHAFVDGQLPAERAAEVEAWLAANPDKAAEIASWTQQNEALATLFAPVAAEPIPSRLDVRALARRPRGPAFAWPQLAAAAMVLIALGGAMGWATREYLRPDASQALIASAVSAHSLFVRENRHAVEVAATDREHLVSWLSNRIERPISTPDLAQEGFTLVGGRLLPATDEVGAGPAAQLMYENAADQRVTVYITAAVNGEEDVSKFANRDRLDAFFWGNDLITCTVVGDLPEDEMKTVARKVYQQLSWRPDSTSGNWRAS
ncbi:anti-sigma factor family protein [Devosia sp.]|uniref:anti-sigma factor family protein n=1 Tax=Devosia sp. TaxID=1871048 RepID=UPI003A92CB90